MSESGGEQPASGGLQAPVRLHYVDTLRVIAVLTVFVFHAFRPFNLTGWMVMNDRTSPVAIGFEALVGPWGMPFFFLLSGAGTWLALRRRTPREYVVERVTRLLVPYVLGSLLLSPLQAYFDWRFWSAREANPRTYLQFWLGRYQGANPTVFDWAGYHLWFLAFLLCVSLVALPVFVWLKREGGRRFSDWLASVCSRRGGLFLFLLPLLAVQMGVRPFAPQSYGWSDLVYYTLFFLIGAFLVLDERMARAVRRDWWLALAGAVLALLVLGAMVAMGVSEAWFDDPSQPGFYVWWAVATIDAWCWIVVMWCAGMRFLDRTSRWLRYGQEAMVPFYVFHQPAIVAVSFYVVQWRAGVALKMLVVFVASLGITLAIVELIRRIAPLRQVLGVKAPRLPGGTGPLS